MNLRVIREPSTVAATMGILLIDGNTLSSQSQFHRRSNVGNVLC